MNLCASCGKEIAEGAGLCPECKPLVEHVKLLKGLADKYIWTP